jgi:hypothetical protein
MNSGIRVAVTLELFHDKFVSIFLVVAENHLKKIKYAREIQHQSVESRVDRDKILNLTSLFLSSKIQTKCLNSFLSEE